MKKVAGAACNSIVQVLFLGENHRTSVCRSPFVFFQFNHTEYLKNVFKDCGLIQLIICSASLRTYLSETEFCVF